MSYFLAHDGRGYVAYRSPNGIRREYVGPRWDTPKAAAAYLRQLRAAEYVSPLRDPAMGSTRAPSPTYVEPIADSRMGVTGASRK